MRAILALALATFWVTATPSRGEQASDPGPVNVGWEGDHLVVYRYVADKGQWSSFKGPAAKRVTIGSACLVIGRSQIAVVTPKLKFAGWLFDLQAHKWTEIPESPAGGMRGTGGAVGAFVDDKLLVWGLTSESPHGAVLDTKTLRWKPMVDAPVAARDRCVHALIGRRFLVWSGTGWLNSAPNAAGPLSDGAIYDLDSNTWEKMPDPPVTFGRGNYGIAWGVWQDRLVLFGGNGSRAGATFDLATRSWKKMSEPDFDVGYLAAHTVVGEYLFLWSGRRDNAGDSKWYPRYGAMYHFPTNQWQIVPEGPLAGRPCAFACALSDKVVVWGGRGYEADGRTARFLVDAAIFNLEKRSWTPIPDVPGRDLIGVRPW